MRLDDFDYYLPKNLIAQKPVSPRDSSRLLVLDRKNKKIGHYNFADFPNFLRNGDVLVFNDSKVFPARVLARKKTGGKIEILLVRNLSPFVWLAMIGGRVKLGIELIVSPKITAKVLGRRENMFRLLFNVAAPELKKTLSRIGKMPTPPYIKTPLLRTNQYQTIYADSRKNNSIAAPTAGFHFTKAVFRELKKRGVQMEFVTLHVGPGTFLPVKTTKLSEHKMHAELAEVIATTLARLKKAKKEGRRIIAVGTTSLRVLETLARQKTAKYFHDWIDLFIYPPFKFKMTDALLTNFHLPKSTLLMLVSAFAGTKLTKRVYQQAIAKKYRCYSFGDAMIVL